MLDTETKRRIDTARDILVGKVPDPKSQVEQITIALIYKFMDDMDQESLEMGGKASFFSGEFEKYSWTKIFDPRLGGFEMLALYADAITRMGLNPNLPQLFRDIFKNAYLPYRDPETLKLFLKTIHEFHYDHSERLGDAFEYLLSVLGSQGDAGQFRTPRHLIDFMVDVLQPQKNEAILDPACGTAGFLIAAYKYILHANSDKTPGDRLSPLEKKKLLANFKGYDISPDMVRLSLVNLYLHGFVQPQVYEYDTLASQERWSDYADVILANPPFMSPKGGIKPHKRFTVQSNRSEVLFVDYMAEHLTPTGRAAIIVPEGIIFQSGSAYKQLRKYLIEQNFLWAVASLPAGVFNPYAGVKTSILFLDRALARKTDQILFVKISADGYDLGAQRRPVDKNDLPDALNVLGEWQSAVRSGKAAEFDLQAGQFSALLVAKSRLAENDDYNLTGDRYRKTTETTCQKWSIVKLGDVCETTSGGTPLRSKSEYYENGTIPWLKSGEVSQGHIDHAEETITELGLKNSSAKIFPKDTVLIAMYGATAGQVGLLKFEAATNQAICGVLPNSKIDSEYLYWVLKNKTEYLVSISNGGAQPNISQTIIRQLQIPLPPLDIQREIVAKIEGYQRIIDGSQQVVDSWKPNLELELEDERKSAGVEAWEVVKLGDICRLLSGGTPSKQNNEYWKGNIPWVSPKDMKEDVIFDTQDHISDRAVEESTTKKAPKDSILVVVRSGILIHTIPVALTGVDVTFNQDIIAMIPQTDKVISEFIFYLLRSKENQILLNGIKRGGTVHSFHSGYLNNLQIPLPPLPIQRAIVARIEAERGMVAANRQLVEIYRGKIKKVIERVWEG